jgi:hypothetical protein
MGRAKMKRMCLLLLLVFISCQPFANIIHQPHGESQHERWLFTGTITAENGQAFGYYYVVDKNEQNVTIDTSVIEIKTNQTLIHYQSSATIAEQKTAINWAVGQSFVKYNPINDSWVFGVEGKKSFNFRLEGFHTNDEPIVSGDGFNSYSMQSNRMNGSLLIDKKERFVTAKNGWINHQWIIKPQDLEVALLLCRFIDDNGISFLKESKKGLEILSKTTWFDEKGQSMAVSQFAKLNKTKKNWELSLILPKKSIVFKRGDAIKISESLKIEAASIEKGERGFCLMLSEVFPVTQKQ